MVITQDMKNYITDCQEELKQLIRDLCAIPAPSGMEQQRAAFCKTWFEKAGGKGVYIDDALNVICPHHVTQNGPVTVFMAHTDTVFPDLEPLPFVETEDTFQCPGVGDDTANLAVMMLCARYFLQNDIAPKQGILFVANSCEEGLGNLKGSRTIVDAFGSRMDALITFDGFSLNKIVNAAVGSHRYRVTVRTEGGHSFGAFGNRNAIAVLANMINTLYSVKVPKEGSSKTTYNVGTIQGGTSVNTIAQEAEMLYEYRSDDISCLEKMQDMFRKVVEAYRAAGAEIDVTLVGDRPCAAGVDATAQAALEYLCRDSVLRVTGEEAQFRSGSTDCNASLSKGIPSVCMGLCAASGAHTRRETLLLASLPDGCFLCMDFLCHYFD